MCTPLEGQLTDVNIHTGHALLGLPKPENPHTPFCEPCLKTIADIEDLTSMGHWTVENLTFVQMLMDNFANGDTVRAFVCENALGTGFIVLRSPLKKDSIGLFDKRVVEILLMPLKDSFVAAAAYQRMLGEIDTQLAKKIQQRINCWRTNLPAARPSRKEAYGKWLN